MAIASVWCWSFPTVLFIAVYSYSSVFKVVWGLPNWTIQMHSRWSSFLLGKGAYKGSARSSSAADQVITGFRGLPAVPSDLAPPAALATRPGFPLLQFPFFSTGLHPFAMFRPCSPFFPPSTFDVQAFFLSYSFLTSFLLSILPVFFPSFLSFFFLPARAGNSPPFTFRVLGGVCHLVPCP